MQCRTLLGVAVGAGTVGVLGAVAGAADQPAGQPATDAPDPVRPAGDRTSPVVATDTTTVGSETYGTARQRASVLDLDSPGRYAVVTRYQLTPGSNYDAGTEWNTASLAVRHDWLSGSVTAHSGDVVPSDGRDGDSNRYVETDGSTGRYEWRLTFDSATGNSRTLRFETVVDGVEAPAAGETLVNTTVAAGFTEGPFGGSERDRATAQVTMQGDDT